MNDTEAFSQAALFDTRHPAIQLIFFHLHGKFSGGFPSYSMPMANNETIRDHDDSVLIARHVRGEQDAFGELYKKYYRRLAGYCYRLLQDHVQTQDVVQAVFTRALKSIHTLEKPESFYYWLFSIARNEVYGVLRAARSNGTVELTEDVWDPETPHESVVRKETASLVGQCLHRLKTEYREVLILRQFEGLSYAEIAAMTGNTISSVESRLFKARKALIVELKPYLERGDINEL